MLTKQDRTNIISLWERTLALPSKGAYATYTKKARMEAIQNTVQTLGYEITIAPEGWVVRPIKKGAKP